MSYKVITQRDPYPFPTLQNDDNFIGSLGEQKLAYSDPTHVAQKQDPWQRLNSTCTLASSRREIFHHDPKSPNDSLDFIMKSHYDQHGSFLATKPDTMFQPETVGVNTGRVLKNRKKEIPLEFDPLYPPLRKMETKDPKKESIHSFKGSINSHHSAATNPGFSRKHDGGLFTT